MSTGVHDLERLEIGRQLLLSHLISTGCAGASAFIKIQGGSFVDENCKEFFFSGYNTWEVGLASSVLYH